MIYVTRTISYGFIIITLDSNKKIINAKYIKLDMM